ncbi:MAG: bifunctional methylenetetrahydrofolate dehydrogenase/methenyltetrahydrofolate cyclohydrolase [Candidatus Taylorbacteria bacterium CG11_big_fil_rev_8_21_14_0_20_46_11]|uniref:Bifunctional protein FolD n=1 Tax=Candidatus Taylorbacteria bacterium CG11_big_fil_rev_8_21_14_0_20_46_11 TaxID=1975025 RepID=A0A2H0KBZ7_9BACT|nr:MAG: bifunctional methylenetetrahydrofolate dehydrogenase/methenyltetrahydrofolate cyclohydrolase [Candidatus Taylorbacteria bacterium CG11_big_fil_rev_8_21_14_0_20_46_11]
MLILDGKKVRDEIAETLKKRVAGCGATPKLAIIQIGENKESTAYIRQKKFFAEKIGAEVDHVQLPLDASTEDVLTRIQQANTDSSVHGILLQLPVPKTLDVDRVIEAIQPVKDVDGLCSVNVKLLWEGSIGGHMPATTRGILSLLDYYQVSVSGKRVVVVGRSFLVGKPTAIALLNRDATVTIAHSKTPNVPQIARGADILITAAGKPHFIQREHVHENQVIIDVGITAITGKKLNDEVPEETLAGDVDFDMVKGIVHALSPVPGGVGPMTVASLFQNLVDACERQQ